MTEIVKHGEIPVEDFKCKFCGCEWRSNEYDVLMLEVGGRYWAVDHKCPECGLVTEPRIVGTCYD